MEFEAISHFLQGGSQGPGTNQRNDWTDRGGTDAKIWKRVPNKVGHHKAKYLVSQIDQPSKGHKLPSRLSRVVRSLFVIATCTVGWVLEGTLGAPDKATVREDLI